MSRATFPAAARLHRPTEFAAALSGRRIARGAYFVVTAHFVQAHDIAQSSSQALLASDTITKDGPSSSPSCARLGLIMAKRFAQHASTRNALKRVVREAFRAKRLELPVADYVVRLNKRIESLSLTELKQIARKEVDGHFLRAQR
jgi:ribonuclease P protein component